MKEIDCFYNKAKKFNNFILENEINKTNIKKLIIYLIELLKCSYELPEVKPNEIAFNREVKRYEIKLNKEIQDGYFQVFNPLKEKEPVAMSIMDDLSDITHDLEFGIMEYEEGRKDNAAFLWKEYFHTHYGDHILNILNVLNIIYREDLQR